MKCTGSGNAMTGLRPHTYESPVLGAGLAADLAQGSTNQHISELTSPTWQDIAERCAQPWPGQAQASRARRVPT